MNTRRLIATCFAALALASFAPSRAAVLFFEDFESTLGLADGNWLVTGSAHIVVDPINAPNHAVAFNVATQAGDLFSKFVAATPGATYYLSFDYLGLTTFPRSGGAIGHGNTFLAVADSTYVDPNVVLVPATDGVWHHYEIAYTNPGVSFRLLLEDFIGPGGNNNHPNDAFFDNVMVADAPAAAPEPATVALALAGLAAAGLGRRRRALS